MQVQELLDEIYNVLPKGIGEDKIRYIIQLEALLATLYNNYVFELGYFRPLVEKDANGVITSANIVSKFDKTEGQAELLMFLKYSYENRDYMRLSVKRVLDRIELIQNVNI